MTKWYEEKSLDEGVVISARVRLARNIKGYPFSKRLGAGQASQLIEKVKESIINDRTPLGKLLSYTDMQSVGTNKRLAMVENHIISPDLVKKTMPCGVITNEDNSINIMVNEEDHIRIQTIFPGNNIEKAYEEASRIDDLIGESIKYAYDEEFGYLTACPTNVGTGMRASYMLHLPMLESLGRTQELARDVSKFGMVMRGIYGEGSKPLGSIYQISNQITLGKNEQEIIASLKSVADQIIDMETTLRERTFNRKATDIKDRVYRAIGTLKYCVKISSAEAMNLLSDLRFGIALGIIEEEICKTNIFNIMMNIQAGNLQSRIGHNANEAERDLERAAYLKKVIL